MNELMCFQYKSNPLIKMGLYSASNVYAWIWTLDLEHWLMIDWHIKPLSHHGAVVQVYIYVYKNIFD